MVKSGLVEIRDDASEPPRIVVVHEPGSFTGDVSQLSGSPCLVSAIAKGDCEVYEVSNDSLREILNRHPDLGDMVLKGFIARRRLMQEPGTISGPRVIGSRYSQDTFRVREFLVKNRMPYTWLDLEDDAQVKQLLERFRLKETDTPVVAFGSKTILRNPSNRELAEALGLRDPLEEAIYDLVIVGAGPAGLAASVYAASEGLSTLVLERTAPGGQAARSMRIENYLGFPTGITGAELTERAVVQASKFGVKLPLATPVSSLSFDSIYPVLHLDGAEKVTAKCLLIATGADYRLLNVEGCKAFECRGVYYAATPIEAQMCSGAEVIVVGGGNSAGQAAVFLAANVRKVHLVIRGNDLFAGMSSYLAHRIEQTANIEVLLNTEVKRMTGSNHLEQVELVDKLTDETRTLTVPGLFSFIGAAPRSEWLPPEIECDADHFVRTGPSLAQSPHWSKPRQPYLLETSCPGVFAAGDVRSGSVKRVASAVGEGAMVVQFVHEYLKEI